MSGIWSLIPSSENPSPRTGSCLLYSSKTRTVYLFGGASHEEGLTNTLYKLSLETLIWEKVILNKGAKEPKTRYDLAAQLVLVNNKEYIVVFAGCSENGLENDLWIFDIDKCSWEEVTDYKGTPPSHRTASQIMSYSTLKAKFYIFGGGDLGYNAKPDCAVYSFDLAQKQWSQVTKSEKSSQQPTPRLGHSFTIVGDKGYLFGGMNVTDFYNDVWIFDIGTSTWELAKPKGTPPSPRSGHSVNVLGGNRMCFYGGMCLTGDPEVFSDVFILHVDTLTWQTIDASIYTPPNPPGSRLSCSSCLVNVENTKLATMVGEKKEILLFFGGMDLKGVFNDLFLLDFDKE